MRKVKISNNVVELDSVGLFLDIENGWFYQTKLDNISKKYVIDTNTTEIHISDLYYSSMSQFDQGEFYLRLSTQDLFYVYQARSIYENTISKKEGK